VQGAFAAPRPVPQLRKPAPAPRSDDPAAIYNGPEDLKQALLHLARWRESGKT
jgi:hypothetical protein